MLSYSDADTHFFYELALHCVSWAFTKFESTTWKFGIDAASNALMRDEHFTTSFKNAIDPDIEPFMQHGRQRNNNVRVQFRKIT